ncbi:MAG: hypothetical protein ACXW4B_00380 [Micavibrio sp.]
MQGTVLQYDASTHKGFISGHDGNRYTFTQLDWTTNIKPKEGMKVDFETSEKLAKEIVAIKDAHGESTNKLPVWTLILGILTVIDAIYVSEDSFVTSDEMGSITLWAGITVLLGLISLIKKVSLEKAMPLQALLWPLFR